MVNMPSKDDDERKALDDLTVLQSVQQTDLGAKQFQGVQTVDQAEAQDSSLVQTIVRGTHREAAAPGTQAFEADKGGAPQPEVRDIVDAPAGRREPAGVGDAEPSGLSYSTGAEQNEQGAFMAPESHLARTAQQAASTPMPPAGTADAQRPPQPAAEPTAQSAAAVRQTEPSQEPQGVAPGQETPQATTTEATAGAAQQSEERQAAASEERAAAGMEPEGQAAEAPGASAEPSASAPGSEGAQAAVAAGSTPGPASSQPAAEPTDQPSAVVRQTEPSQEPQGVAVGHEEHGMAQGETPGAPQDSGSPHEAGPVHEAAPEAEPAHGMESHDDAGRHGGFGNNGLGNGLDEPPPGMPDANPNADTAFDSQGEFIKGAGHGPAEAEDSGHSAQEPQGMAQGETPGAPQDSGSPHEAGPVHEAAPGVEPAHGMESHDDAGRHGGFGNNGLGNGLDEPPPGMPDANPNADTAFDSQGEFIKGAGHGPAEAEDLGHSAQEPQGMAQGETPGAPQDSGSPHEAGPVHEAAPEAEPAHGMESHDDAGRHGGFGNNGLGNGLDEPPPGMPDANPNADTAFDSQGEFIKGAGQHVGAEDSGPRHADQGPDASHGGSHADTAAASPAPPMAAGLTDAAHTDLLTQLDSGSGHGAVAGGWAEMVQSPVEAASHSGLSQGDWTAAVEHEPPKPSPSGGGRGAMTDSSPSHAPDLEAFHESAHDTHKGQDV